MRKDEGFIDVPGGKVWYCRCGDPGKIPFIALHGGPGANSNLQHVFEGLADERQVIYYDQLGGTGKSDVPQDPSIYTLERSVEELQCVREALGLTELHLHGQSFGTILATAYALKYPHIARSIVLSSPAINLSMIEDEMERLAKKLPAPHNQVILNKEAALAKTPEWIDAFILFQSRHFTYRQEILDGIRDALENGEENIVKRTMVGRIGFHSHGTLKDINLIPRLPEIEAPLLFACGRHEHCSPDATAAAHAVVSHSEFHIFEHSAHFPQLSETELYLKCIRAFIQKHD